MATFGKETLSKFADACASIPLRPLDRAFDRTGIRAGVTNDDSGGARRIRFRQYLSTIDQRDARQLQQLGDALGALIDEVADSKKEFLIRAAENDGFSYKDGAFCVARVSRNSFAIRTADQLTSAGDLGRRLEALIGRKPKEAIGGAKELARSVVELAAPAPTPTHRYLKELALILESIDGDTPACARLVVATATALAAFIAETQRLG
jgi:hypothetical protein